MSETIEIIRHAAAPHGLNLVAATPVARYDAAVKEVSRAGAIDETARSIVIVGNGGAAMWQAFQRHLAAHPGWFQRDNPLDDFTRDVIERDVVTALSDAGRRSTIVYPFMSNGPTLNFIELAKIAGLAGPSILGVTVHPTYGPWIAFRAAILLDEELDSPGEAENFDPCPRCVPRSCMPACPVGAISVDAGWDIPKCLTHRVEVEPECAPRCYARAGCVLGPEHRYPDDELAYHQMRSLRAMRPYYESHLKPTRKP
jgi:NAD-dependent dihydropyrimidine dehydrogenase PreA subunit